MVITRTCDNCKTNLRAHGSQRYCKDCRALSIRNAQRRAFGLPPLTALEDWK